jgi:hypothetical protein
MKRNATRESLKEITKTLYSTVFLYWLQVCGSGGEMIMATAFSLLSVSQLPIFTLCQLCRCLTSAKAISPSQNNFSYVL